MGPQTVEQLCDLHDADTYYAYNDYVGVQDTDVVRWYQKTDTEFVPTGTTPEPHGTPHTIDQEAAMIRRRNAPISDTEANVLWSILARHGHQTNPQARPGENDIPTQIIKRRKNPRKKVKLIGPGCRWKTRKSMLRYMAKIRGLWLKRHKSGRKARR